MGLLLLGRPRQHTMRIGINSSSAVPYSQAVPFIDIFKCAQGWFGQGNGGGDKCDLDDNLWPLSLNKTTGGSYTSLSAFLNTSIQPDPAGLEPIYKPGDYVVHKTGTGTVSYANDAVVQSTSSSRDVFTVTTPTTDGIRINVTAVTSGPMTFRVCHVDDEAEMLAGRVSNPDWAAKFSRFSAFRAMDMGESITNGVTDWSTRTPFTSAFWAAPRGEKDGTPAVDYRPTPVEAIVAICNETNMDLYMCMPFGSTDDYLTNCATYVRDNLNSNLKCYIEFGNEFFNVIYGYAPRYFWTDAFMAAAYADFPSAVSDFQAGFDWSLVRAVKMAETWKTVWNSTGQLSRLVRVMASQASYDDRVRYQLEFTNPSFSGQAGTHFDALATAPYFGSDSGSNGSLTVDQMFQEIDSGGTGAVGAYTGGWIKQSIDWITANKIRANAYGMRLICYEGGQHFVDYAQDEPALQDLYQSVNLNSKMYTSYSRYLSDLEAQGVDLFIHYNDVGPGSGFGYWGSIQGARVTSQPKYDALSDYQAG